ncbi:MAG: hypothetical protein ACSLFK_03840 [Gemmatimonadaceae bacterium]
MKSLSAKDSIKRIYFSIPHLIGLVTATGLLWFAWGFSRIVSQEPPVDPVTTWLGGMREPRPWIVLLLIFPVVVAISRLQDSRPPISLRHSMIWPLLGWFAASTPRLLTGLLERTPIRLLPFVIELAGYLCAGLILFKAKEIARRDPSSGPGDLAEESRYGV